MQPKDVYTLLQEQVDAETVFDFSEDEISKHEPFCFVKADKLRDVCQVLISNELLAFDFLLCITGVDMLNEDKLLSVYHLFSYQHRHTFVMKVSVPRDAPIIPSVASLWKTANWQEREQYDLLGIQYQGHPELKRLLLPDDWVGHPLRKDYVEEDQYRTMSTTRYSVMGMLSVYDENKPQTEGEKPHISGSDRRTNN